MSGGGYGYAWWLATEDRVFLRSLVKVARDHKIKAGLGIWDLAVQCLFPWLPVGLAEMVTMRFGLVGQPRRL